MFFLNARKTAKFIFIKFFKGFFNSFFSYKSLGSLTTIIVKIPKIKGINPRISHAYLGDIYLTKLTSRVIAKIVAIFALIITKPKTFPYD